MSRTLKLSVFLCPLLKSFDVDFRVKYGLTGPEVDLTYEAGITLRF